MNSVQVDDLKISWKENNIYKSLEIQIECPSFENSLKVDGIQHSNSIQDVLHQICYRLLPFKEKNNDVRHTFSVFENQLHVINFTPLEWKTLMETLPTQDICPQLQADYKSILTTLHTIGYTVEIIKDIHQKDWYWFYMKNTGNIYQLYASYENEDLSDSIHSDFRDIPFLSTLTLITQLKNKSELNSPQDFYEVNHTLSDYIDYLKDGFHVKFITNKPN